MPSYSYAGLVLLSELPLDTLLPTRKNYRAAPAGFIVHYLKSPPPDPAERDWLHHWQTKDGRITLSLAGSGESFLLRFPSLADFLIDKNIHRIGVWPTQYTDTETLQHLLLDHVLPRLLGHRRLLVLHASAVVDPHGSIIAFAGDSGRGKSTLAANMHTVGFPAICDDGLVITSHDGCSNALPLYPGLRLWPESIAAVNPDALSFEFVAQCSGKSRAVMTNQNNSKLLPLTAVYILAPPPLENGRKDISIDRLTRRDACVELMRNSFRLHLKCPNQVSKLLALTADIVSQVPIFTLKYPRDYSALAEVHETICHYIG